MMSFMYYCSNRIATDWISIRSYLSLKWKKQWKIESILNDRIHRKRRQFFVKWLNYSDVENQWTKKVNLKNCKKLLIVYNENRQIKKKIINVSTRKRRKIDKKKRFVKKSMTRFFFFQNFIIKKIFYLILKKFDDHLKKEKTTEKV